MAKLFRNKRKRNRRRLFTVLSAIEAGALIGSAGLAGRKIYKILKANKKTNSPAYKKNN